jgi:hypothetical protein
MDGIGLTWAEWLGNWVSNYFGQRGEDPTQLYPAEFNIHDRPPGVRTAFIRLSFDWKRHIDAADLEFHKARLENGHELHAWRYHGYNSGSYIVWDTPSGKPEESWNWAIAKHDDPDDYGNPELADYASPDEYHWLSAGGPDAEYTARDGEDSVVHGNHIRSLDEAKSQAQEAYKTMFPIGTDTGGHDSGVDYSDLNSFMRHLDKEGRLAALDPEILHQKRHDIGQHLAPENHPTDSWADCPNCSWYGLGDERDWNPDQSQDPFDPRMIGASRDPLLADVAEALNFSAAVVKRASPSSSAVYVLLPHWDPEACVGILNAHHSAAQGRVALPVMDEKWTSDVMDAAKKGGFTLRDHVGDGPTSGHMVSLYKDSEFKRPIRELNADDVRNFVSKNAEALDKPHHYLGGWLEGGHFYLDVSVHVPEMNRATTEAVRNHQLGIYDLNNGRTLDTSEAGYLTGHPGVVGSRNDGPVSPSAQGRRRADRRDHAGGGGPHRR